MCGILKAFLRKKKIIFIYIYIIIILYFVIIISRSIFARYSEKVFDATNRCQDILI